MADRRRVNQSDAEQAVKKDFHRLLTFSVASLQGENYSKLPIDVWQHARSGAEGAPEYQPRATPWVFECG
jgi:hypothetical protein